MIIYKTSRITTVVFVLILLAGCGGAQPTASSVPPLPTSTTAFVSPTPDAVLRPTTPTAPLDSPQAIVTQLVAAKITAMQAKDIEGYLSLLNEADKAFYMEQRNWFIIYQDAVTSDFSIEVKQVEKINDTTLVASLKQHYLYGPEKAERTIYYDEKYIQTPNGWKDAELNFEVKETAHFVIKYQKDVAANAAEVFEEAEKGYASVAKTLELEIPEKATIKLYSTQELLRQSSDIRVAYLFNGWGEDGESIKLYARRERSVFAPVIAHELVHKITLEVTDSLNSWLAEGLATYFGNQPFRGGNLVELKQYTAKELAKPIAWLEETNLIQATDGETIRQFYAISGMVVEFMVKTYGLGQVKALLNELSKFPRYDHGFDYGVIEFLADAEVTGVSAHAIAPRSHHVGRDDNFVATMSFADGSVASLTYTALGHAAFPKETAELFVDGKVAVLEDYRRLRVVGAPGRPLRTPVQDKGLKDELVAFADGVNGKIWPSPWWQQLQAARIALAVEEQLGPARGPR